MNDQQNTGGTGGTYTDTGASQSTKGPLLRRYAAHRGPIGLALGGGGARGIAHVGVLEALERYPRLYPRIFAGTSAGSVIAVMAAAGLAPEEIREFSEDLDWFKHVIRVTDLIDLRNASRAGLFPNTRLAEVVEERVDGRSFDEFPFDVAVTATDIEYRRRVIMTSSRVAKRIDRRELERFLPPRRGHLPGAETVVLTDVSVGLAIRASCAVPGFFRPVQVGGMNLVDGGVVDQTPVDVVRAMGASFSIGVSLALSFMPQKLVSAKHALSGTVGMLGIQQLRKSLEAADIGFQVSGIDARSPVKPHQVDLIDIGRADMTREIERYFGRRGARRLRKGSRRRVDGCHDLTRSHRSLPSEGWRNLHEQTIDRPRRRMFLVHRGAVSSFGRRRSRGVRIRRRSRGGPDLQTGVVPVRRGMAEVVRVTFDADVISLREILDFFWQAPRPDDAQPTGSRCGTRSTVRSSFTQTTRKRSAAEESKAAAQADFPDPIVTEIQPAGTFYPAEEYHKDYYEENSRAGYCRLVIQTQTEETGVRQCTHRMIFHWRGTKRLPGTGYGRTCGDPTGRQRWRGVRPSLGKRSFSKTS